MDRHLARNTYFVGDRCSVADLALYAHTHVAPEGDFDLSGFQAVTDWLARIAAEPGHITMTQAPEGAVVSATLAEV
jgi:glutathione S-transferase